MNQRKREHGIWFKELRQDTHRYTVTMVFAILSCWDHNIQEKQLVLAHGFDKVQSISTGKAWRNTTVHRSGACGECVSSPVNAGPTERQEAVKNNIYVRNCHSKISFLWLGSSFLSSQNLPPLARNQMGDTSC